MLPLESITSDNALSRTAVFAKTAAYAFFIVYNREISIHLNGLFRTDLNTFGAGYTAHLAGVNDRLSLVPAAAAYGHLFIIRRL